MPVAHEELMRNHLYKAAPPKAGVLRIVPLGGLEEVGRNMTVFEYENDIVIVDMGLQFPEEDMPGIDYIIPNVGYLILKRKNIRAVIITHAHYDHIGGIPHVMPQLGERIPIYATDMTAAYIQKRQEDFKERPVKLDLRTITSETKIKLGVFEVEFFGVAHNVPGSVGVVLHTPVGTILHTGDFKIDLKSDTAGHTDEEKLKRLAKRGVLLLMSDSTNAREPGHQFSEAEIKMELEEIIKNAGGRLIIGTFASILGRLNQIIQLGEKYKKKIVIDGRSMKTSTEIGRRLGYIKVNPKTLIPIEEAHRYPPEKVMMLVTGAQGEERAVLMRIANREHRFIQVEPGDTVVFSSSVVPGNERTVQRLTDQLYREGADVINYRMLDIHAGGHAKQEDLKTMVNWVNPKHLMPIEGNHSFLKLHKKAAIEAGFDPKKILIADNGQIVEATKDEVKLTNERVPATYVFVDGLGVGDVGEVVLRDRQALAQDGMFVIIALVDSKTGRVRQDPDIISRGFVYLRESRELVRETKQKVKEIVESSTASSGPVNWTYIRDNLRERIGQFLFSKTQRRPLVLPVVMEV